MKNKIKEIPKEIKKILEDEHDSTREYVEECLQEHEDESAEEGLEKVNAIRKFLGSESLDLNTMKKELILENLQ